jgi:hypothetical protein
LSPCARLKDGPTAHPVPSRPVRSHAEVTGPSALRHRLRVWCRPLHRGQASITLFEPCSIVGKSSVASSCCRRPARASAPPLPSTGKRTAIVPPSSFEMVSCCRLAASASSSRQVEPCCSTKFAASGHASCVAILVDQGRPRLQRPWLSFVPECLATPLRCRLTLLPCAGPSHSQGPLPPTTPSRSKRCADVHLSPVSSAAPSSFLGAASHRSSSLSPLCLSPTGAPPCRQAPSSHGVGRPAMGTVQ